VWVPAILSATSPIFSPVLSVPLSSSALSISHIIARLPSARPLLLPVSLQIFNSILGRVEIRAFLAVYFITLPLQLLTTGSFLKQGSTTLVAFTALHAGAVAALFWTLLGNALVATQVVEDGTPSSLIVRPLISYLFSALSHLLSRAQPFYLLTAVLMAITTYISFDIAFTITSTFEPSNPKSSLHSTALFVLTSIWPGACVPLFFPFRIIPLDVTPFPALHYFTLF
jgi:hypothetical protein